MKTITYFEQKLYPPNDDGRTDESKPAHNVEVITSRYFGSTQIYLMIEDVKGAKTTFHLTKEMAKSLSEGVINAHNHIGFGNT